MELKDIVSGRLVASHCISSPICMPRSGGKISFTLGGYHKNNILVNQSLVIESSTGLCGFNMIREVRLQIGPWLVETHSGQLLKDLAGNSAVSDPTRTVIPLQFFYCRGKTPVVLDALAYHEVKVNVEFNTLDCDITRCELDSIVVTPERIRDPSRDVIEIITEECPEAGYKDVLVVGDKVYYIVNKTIHYDVGTFTLFEYRGTIHKLHNFNNGGRARQVSSTKS